MYKILLTGDAHIGRGVSGDDDFKTRYAEARLESLAAAFRYASVERCDIAVISGDLFDTNYHVSTDLVDAVCNILSPALFSGPILILPGNHDFYDRSDDTLWHEMQKRLSPNVTLMLEERPYTVTGPDGPVFYPCICHSKHSAVNSLGWLTDITPGSGIVNIGVAHGSIEGTSLDSEGQYFPMTRKELAATGLNLWLMGHAHTAFDVDLGGGVHAYNAGTPQSTDLADRSGSQAMLVSILDDGSTAVKALPTGQIDFADISVNVGFGDDLKAKLAQEISAFNPARTALRMKLMGSISAQDYDCRAQIYEKLLSGFLYVYGGAPDDTALIREVTAEMVEALASGDSVFHSLLAGYIENGRQEMAALAYDLMIRARKQDR